MRSQRLGAAGGVDHEHVDAGGPAREHALGVARRQDPLDARPEADARGGRPAQLLDEAVVATAATTCSAPRPAPRAELEGGVGVVVEAADQARLDAERDARAFSPARTRSKWRLPSGDRWSVMWGASAATACVIGRFESRTRMGWSVTLSRSAGSSWSGRSASQSRSSST